MSNKPAPTRLADRIAYRASFITGMAAALPEFSTRAFRLAQPAIVQMNAKAPSAAGFGDGYDLVADFAAKPTGKHALARPLIGCFLRGHNNAFSA